ncbi:Unsaturated rhamnogalacturonyl hydrolase YteR [Colletotrichum orbiculare MAFF 240422]|uniref:Unsaturated rhamnogalacturonyl hydrolase YteR n=1 Tax=Colletotrichum orbiculare (strain 104-T / ATCC 96160 / CBS 514.97 / LARS 414 / MAFF 240422) TaxID=1213857 RepID=N4V8P7_COLOR|nr:Unsaturated rhamnogalacturonyl hydrolase YteR [Colletotrichum orbiculare MAFF 240422]
MKCLRFLTYQLAAASFASAAPTCNRPPFSSWMTDSMIRRGVTPSFHYDQATLYTSFEAVYAHNQNQTVYDYYRAQVDAVVFPNGTIDGFNHSRYSLDPYRFGNNVLFWYEETGEEKYRIAADRIKATLDGHPRTPTGGFWHREVVYPNQMWLDGIYMADTFYAKYVSLFQPENQTAWDDIVRQFDNIDARTRRGDNLLVHGYDESKKAVWADPVTGAAPLVWGRAVGWYFMALLEVIDLLPHEQPGRQRLLGYFTGLAEGLKGAQDETGGWWNIMEERYEDVKGNYIESSASVMFTFGWLRGLNLGFLSEEQYLEPAQKAWNGMVDMFVTYNGDGTINWEGTVEVGSLGSNATFEYYSSIGIRKNDLRGAGVFMNAAVEWEKGFA